jgi:hypothetical protein
MFSSLFFICLLVGRTISHPLEPTKTSSDKSLEQQHLPGAGMGGQPPNCFPAIGFKMPANVHHIEGVHRMADWWCDYRTEYAFMGFSYEVSACK